MGRPSGYSAELAELVCSRIAQNTVSLRKLCQEDDMPSVDAILGWLAKDPAFAAQYARAKELQMELMADDILDISDDGTNDWIKRRSDSEKGGGFLDGRVLDQEHVQRSRLRVDSRKWLASKLAPKKYGDKLQHSGDEDNPVVHKHEVSLPPLMTREEWLLQHRKGEK